MPGNEQEVARYLYINISKISLNHIGRVREIGRPGYGKDQIILLKSENEIKFISSDDATKKADFYINRIGVSVKQSGGDFKFNRLQRANLQQLFESFNLSNVDKILSKMDLEVNRFHNRDESSPNRMIRNRPWQDFFKEDDFRTVLELLMMKQSPNYGISDHPAELILIAPKEHISAEFIDVYTFNEYFERYKDEFKIAIRRVWYGQKGGEHRRARGLMKKEGNAPWVYDSVAGQPSSGWRTCIPVSDRKTVYLLFIS